MLGLHASVRRRAAWVGFALAVAAASAHAASFDVHVTNASGEGVEDTAVVLEPIGFNWQISIALVPGMAAREVAISALGTVYALSDAQASTGADTLGPIISQQWSLATALSLLAWFVFAPQCLSTLATIRRESRSWKIPLISATYLFVLAYLASFVTYRLALAFT